MQCSEKSARNFVLGFKYQEENNQWERLGQTLFDTEEDADDRHGRTIDLSGGEAILVVSAYRSNGRTGRVYAYQYETEEEWQARPSFGQFARARGKFICCLIE